MVAVSSTRGDGLDDLRRTLESACAELSARPAEGPARLPVDRVFTVEGFGTVVTGTLWSGVVAVGDRLSPPRRHLSKIHSMRSVDAITMKTLEKDLRSVRM